MGLGRVYVKLPEGQLDFDKWCEGREARPLLCLRRPQPSDRLPGQRPRAGTKGSELKLEAPATVKVTAQVAAHLDSAISAEARAIAARPLDQKPYWELERARLGDTRKVPVEVIVNGQSVAKTEITADGSVEGVSFDVPIKKSSWVALRIYPSSHTNPVFVTVGGKPIRASKKSAEWCLKSVDQCWPKKEPAIRKTEKEAAKKAYDVAP